MNFHPTIQKNLYGYLKDDLSLRKRQAVESHLKSCERCAAELRSLREAMSLLDKQAVRPSGRRSDLYWQQFAQKVDQKIQLGAVDEESTSVVGRLLEMLMENRKPFAVGFASALSLIMIALAVWGLWIKAPSSEQLGSDIPSRQRANGPTVNVEKAVLETRAEEYLEQSKVILIGLMNADPRSFSKSGSVLQRQREISRQLVRESREITSRLTDPSQQRLKELISDLGLILVQIANLENGHDLQGVEIVRSGVEQNGILFKINLEEIRRVTRSSSKKGTERPAKPTI